MAIVTTTSRGNVAALLGAHLGPRWQDRFAAVVCAEDAPVKKPDPQAYRLVLERLQLPARGHGCDRGLAPWGWQAASAVGIPVVITRSMYFANDPVAGALAVGPRPRHGDGLDARGWTPTPRPAASGWREIRRWHASRG